MYNFSQEQIFIFFFIIGIIIGILFDIFRVIRKSFKTPDTLTFIEDLLFLISKSLYGWLVRHLCEKRCGASRRAKDDAGAACGASQLFG